MEELERLRLQVKIMANTIDTQEKTIKELKRVLPQTTVIKSVCEHCGFQPMIKVDDEYQCEICGNTQK